jgi:hypothetical protein
MSLTGGVNDAAANLSCEETSRPRVRGRNLFYKNRASCSPMLRQVRSGWGPRTSRSCCTELCTGDHRTAGKPHNRPADDQFEAVSGSTAVIRGGHVEIASPAASPG